MDPTGFRTLVSSTLSMQLCSTALPKAMLFSPFLLTEPPPTLRFNRRRHSLKLYSKPFLRFSSLLNPTTVCSAERSDAHPWSQNGNEAVSEVSYNKLLHVVLVSPQIPGNTGCIARTCAATAVGLHLVEPLGFQIDDTKLKRAGLDYWPYVVMKVHSSWPEFRDYFRQQEGEKRLLAFTKRGTTIHTNFTYRQGDWLLFGSETCGLPPEALLDCNDPSFGGGGTLRIPMVETYVRCLNLSVSVGIALYEASRQLNYEQLQYPTETYIDNKNTSISEDIFA